MFLHVDDEINPKVLRELDKPNDGIYKLVIIDDPKKGLRGADFRHPTNEAMLLILRSFSYRR